MLFYFFHFFFSFYAPVVHGSPGLGVEVELQLPVYTTATATQDLSHTCDLCRSSQQCGILNPLSEAMGRTCILRDTMSGSEPPEPQWELPGFRAFFTYFYLFIYF